MFARLSALRLQLLVITLTLLAGGGAAQATTPQRLVMVGDSLTAGFQLADEDALPAQLQAELRARGHHTIEVLNAGVSGDTSGDGLNRFGFSIGGEADGVILALGANDALQGRDLEILQANLAAMVSEAQARGLPVLLVSVRPPLNLGTDYRTAFEAVFPALAARFSIPLHEDLLGAVALQPELMMADGMHPTAAGIAPIAARLADTLEATLLHQSQS